MNKIIIITGERGKGKAEIANELAKKSGKRTYQLQKSTLEDAIKIMPFDTELLILSNITTFQEILDICNTSVLILRRAYQIRPERILIPDLILCTTIPLDTAILRQDVEVITL